MRSSVDLTSRQLHSLLFSTEGNCFDLCLFTNCRSLTSHKDRRSRVHSMAYQSQQQQQDNRNPNRLHLNFGFNNQQNFAAEQGRAFPTTPSTFPQPFPNSAGHQEVWGTQQTTSGITSQGYFYNNPQAGTTSHHRVLPVLAIVRLVASTT